MTTEKRELPRVLSLRDATMLVVSSVIGVGIFLTPGGVAKAFPSAGWFFFAWLLGGALALAGALANAELGAMFPRAGGNYVYLRAAYHPMAGFLVGWLSFFAIFAGTVATLAVGFTISLSTFFVLTPAAKVAVAITVIWVASGVNAYATRAGAALNTSTAYLKLGAMFALVALGPILGHARTPAEPFVTEAETTLSGFGVGLQPVLFSYLGWNASVFVAGEIDKPERNLPRSLFWGLGICTSIYVLVTGTYVYALGMQALPGMPVVGIQAGGVLFGAKGGAILAVIMMVSIFGTVNANVLVGPRIAYAMASDGLFFRAAARLNAAKTPHVAVLVQASVASALVIAFKANSDSLDEVLRYTTFAITLATISDTIALYVLRVRDPDRPRPYRAAGYPIVPLLYIVANLAIAISTVKDKPRECLASLGVLLAGAPVYAIFRWRGKARGSGPE
ncbi:MAG: amino acid permease [Labilithrix sp.]|nr:amino acid permease [Labilithrix sp.]MCW5816681.1 amino acid permease [Labilithrix sp.]